ncbi:MAG: hypothetical protein ACYC1U_11080 [Candidatus Aquicultorales bacterium]
MVTLACAECNSFVGTKIESFETNRAKFERALRGIGDNAISVMLTAYDSNGISGQITASMSGRLKNGQAGFMFMGVPQASDPSSVAEFNQFMKEKAAIGGKDWGFKFSHISPMGWKRARLTYLHAAFMRLFHEFGYEWALDSCTDTIRRQIMNPTEEIIPLSAGTIKLRNDAANVKGLPVRLLIDPPEVRGFFVIMPELDYMPRVGVWLPVFGQTHSPPEDAHGTISFRQWDPLHSRLVDEHSVGVGHRLVEQSFADAMSSSSLKTCLDS